MRLYVCLLVLASMLIGCSEQEEDNQVLEAPLQNKVKMSFIGTEDEDKVFGAESGLSRVECSYDRDQNSLRLVAYKFAHGESELEITESLQLSDAEVDVNQSGLLKPVEEEQVPSFVFISKEEKIYFSKQSKCSTYYDINGDEIQGNILCSALQSDVTEKTFVSLEFQCMNQSFLLFELKQEMLKE